MEKLNTIQKHNNLNEVYVLDETHPINNGHHRYRVMSYPFSSDIQFQNGPRNEQSSIQGILDVDLLEIVRHRLQSFQSGKYATRENAIALTHIEEALLWMNKRVEDRAETGKLGTNKI
jgi:hypothetical protein